ncbi:MAG TPA: hypothetical protein VFK26_06415, partial [Gemmatimonadaceae bacterium]|nr:hypothetical protein [Gemmatimonadaceae bacterium]
QRIHVRGRTDALRRANELGADLLNGFHSPLLDLPDGFDSGFAAGLFSAAFGSDPDFGPALDPVSDALGSVFPALEGGLWTFLPSLP